VDPLGPYQPLNELARGGMGVVYRARDTRSGELVALKVLLDLACDLELLERFGREVEVAGEVEHPHLVRVLDADLRPPRPWAAFELVEGGTLERRVLRDGPLPWREAVRIVSEVAAGVSAAHEKGLLHRDIKPANVLLGPAGAKLADFGLVKDLDRETLTQTGATLGTPAYLAPEQVGSEKARWGPATDVYGLAAAKARTCDRCSRRGCEPSPTRAACGRRPTRCGSAFRRASASWAWAAGRRRGGR